MSCDKSNLYAKKIYNCIYRNYTLYRHSKTSFNELVEKPEIFKLLKKVRNKKILDAGCGSGEYSLEFKKKGAKVFPVDISEKMIEITNRKGLTGIVKDILSSDFKDKYFDIILCTLVINYIKDFDKFLKEMHRILKKGGILILSDVHPIRTAVERVDGKIKSLTIKEYITKKFYNTVLGGKKIKVYRRTVSEMLNALIKNKFSILKMSEPYYKYKKRISDDKYYLSKNPMYIIFLARKE